VGEIAGTSEKPCALQAQLAQSVYSGLGLGDSNKSHRSGGSVRSGEGKGIPGAVSGWMELARGPSGQTRRRDTCGSFFPFPVRLWSLQVGRMLCLQNVGRSAQTQMARTGGHRRKLPEEVWEYQHLAVDVQG